MSNLLKKDLESGVAAFGFPVIQRGGEVPSGPESEVTPAAVEAPPEPREDVEEIFRKRLLELERRAQEIEKEAYAKGFASGEKDGFEYGQKAVQVVKTQLERIASTLEETPAKALFDYRDWLIRTSLKIARQVVRKELLVSPEIISRTVAALLEEAEEHTTLTVYLNPQDLEFMEKRAELDLSANRKHFVLKANKNLERGDCRVESAIQLLDASIESQFANLEDFILRGAGEPEAAGNMGEEDEK